MAYNTALIVRIGVAGWKPGFRRRARMPSARGDQCEKHCATSSSRRPAARGGSGAPLRGPRRADAGGAGRGRVSPGTTPTAPSSAGRPVTHAARIHGLPVLPPRPGGMRRVPHRAGIRRDQGLAKAGDLEHVFDTTFHNYEYPIRARKLRPASDTCEQCHSPQKFSDDSLREDCRLGDDRTTAHHTYLVSRPAAAASATAWEAASTGTSRTRSTTWRPIELEQ